MQHGTGSRAHTSLITFFILQAFCNQTSLHGWQYITQRPETDGFWAGEATARLSQPSNPLMSGFKHIFWSIIVCVAMGCAAIFLYSNTIDFMNATVVTTVDTMTVPLSEVFFPSVVVCNINQVGLYVSQLSKKIKWVLLRK